MTDLLILNTAMGSGKSGFGVGGAERVLAELYNNLPDSIDAKLMVMEDNDIAYHINSNRTISTVKKHVYPHIISYFPKIRHLFNFINYYIELQNSHAKVSLSFDTMCHLINIFACIFTKCKCIVSFRINPFPPNDSTNRKIIMKILVHLSKYHADKIIVNSFGLRNELINKYHIKQDKIITIYNPKNITDITEKKIEPIVDCNIFSQEIPLIFTAGRLEIQKGQWHLIRVFSEIKKTIPNAKLVICGEGKLETRLKELCTELMIDDDVIFLGFCKNVYKYMYNSSVFVLPSLYEGQPNVLIEALICNCNVVATNCPYGPAEILENGIYGRLTKPLDNENFDSKSPLTSAEIDLLQAIIDALEPDSKNKYKPFSDRLPDFTKDNICNKYVDVFREMINSS